MAARPRGVAEAAASRQVAAFGATLSRRSTQGGDKNFTLLEVDLPEVRMLVTPQRYQVLTKQHLKPIEQTLEPRRICCHVPRWIVWRPRVDQFAEKAMFPAPVGLLEELLGRRGIQARLPSGSGGFPPKGDPSPPERPLKIPDLQGLCEWSQPGSNRRPPACKADRFVHSCLIVSRKCLQLRHFCWPRKDTKGRRETNWCPLGVRDLGRREEGGPACPAASARGCGRGRGRSCVGDRRLRVEPRHILKLVHHVAIRAEGEPRVVPELASDVDHRAPLVE